MNCPRVTLTEVTVMIHYTCNGVYTLVAFHITFTNAQILSDVSEDKKTL